MPVGWCLRGPLRATEGLTGIVLTWSVGDFDLVLFRSGDGDLRSCDSLLVVVDEAISATDHILGFSVDESNSPGFEPVVDALETSFELVGNTEVDVVLISLWANRSGELLLELGLESWSSLWSDSLLFSDSLF